MKINNLLDAINKHSLLCSREQIILEILLLYNCRAAEVLSARWQNYVRGKRLILKGKKKSFDIIITDRIILEKIYFLPRLHNNFIFYPTNYNRIYHLIKTQFSHLFVKYKTNKYNKITHAFRYSNIEGLTDEDSIQTILHHKSKKTQKFYTKSLNKKKT